MQALVQALRISAENHCAYLYRAIANVKVINVLYLARM
jgi:hypothetical protein